MTSLFIGIMSGTSLDGADALLADFSSPTPRTLAFASVDYDDALRRRLLALSSPGEDLLEPAAEASLLLAGIYAALVQRVIREAGVERERVGAIGCHGQTVRHRPARGFTIQLNAPAVIAEKTGIDVVADVRSRDLAAGGQGAPLVPAFHAAFLGDPQRTRAVINIGGISNITLLSPKGPRLGFDCGPGNMLMDAWCQRHQGEAFDKDGAWADSGQVHAGLLAQLLDEPYFSEHPPKSTGRELFGIEWLEPRLMGGITNADVQATLTELTAASIARSLDAFCPATEEVFVCGGGARNRSLMARLGKHAGGRPVKATDEAGIPSGHVEPMAFAWFALKCVRREPIDMTAFTGARGARILGAIYPA